MLKTFIKEQEIIHLLKIHYGIDVQATKCISGGADINAIVYKADAKSNSYFVKLKCSDHDKISLSIVDLLHDSGIEEIIVPLKTLDGKLSQQLDHFKIIVYPFIHAPNGFTRNLTEIQWKQLGKALRKIHAISLPASIQQELRKEKYSSKWREMLRSFFSKMNPAPADDLITIEFKDLFKKHSDIIHRIIDSADVLSKKIQPELDKYVLCHSDIHAGNILINADDDSIYIIDWDEPMLAPKERDLMFIGGGVGNVWNNPQEVDYFYQGYGKTNINKTILSYYRYERIVEDIALYTKDLLLREQSDKVRLEMFRHFKVMFNPNDVIEIAFASLLP